MQRAPERIRPELRLQFSWACRGDRPCSNRRVTTMITTYGEDDVSLGSLGSVHLCTEMEREAEELAQQQDGGVSLKIHKEEPRICSFCAARVRF
mmetsp:Transcript_187/g.420  ORF Transcript_187/g.420 Transcript_187/m.420 type:complete len:94 (+) Transcript_187:219-500(+)